MNSLSVPQKELPSESRVCKGINQFQLQVSSTSLSTVPFLKLNAQNRQHGKITVTDRESIQSHIFFLLYEPLSREKRKGGIAGPEPNSQRDPKNQNTINSWRL